MLSKNRPRSLALEPLLLVFVLATQPVFAAEPPVIYTERLPAFTLAFDAATEKKLEKAKALLADKKWEEGCALVQEVLDMPTDVLIRTVRKGRQADYVNASAQAEA